MVIEKMITIICASFRQKMSHLSGHDLTFSQQLQKHITESGYSVSQVARLSDLSKRTLANWVSGYVKKPRHAEDLMRVCETLQLSPVDTRELFTLAGLSAPESMVSHSPFHLKPDLPYFVGREKEIEQITSDVTGSNLKFAYAIVGMAGVGKTALAHHLAHQLQSHFPDGVLWAQADDPGSVETILTSFALSFGVDVTTLPDIDSKSRVWRTLLHNKKTIIILDNVEQFSHIEALIPARGNNLLMITTRHKGFGILQGVEHIPIEPFGAETWQIVRHFLPEERIEAEKEDLARLIQQSGGLALALTIAMCRLATEPHWTVAEFNRELESIHTIETDDVSVYRSFQMSYQRLPEFSKLVFSVSGLFNRESIPTDALAHILDIPREQVAIELNLLHRVSLIQYQDEHLYSLHPLLSQFARSIVPAENLQLRFIDYYVRYIENYFHDYEAITRQREHILKMFDVAETLKLIDAPVTAIAYFFAYLENLDLLPRLESHLKQLYARLKDGEDKDSLAMIAYYYGRFQRRIGNLEDGESLSRIALDLAIETEQIRVILLCHNSLGVHALKSEQFEDALSHFAVARGIIYEHDLFGYRYSNLINTANVYYQMERYEEARETAQEVLSYVTDIENEAVSVQIMVGHVYALLRHVAFHQGDIKLSNHYQHLGLALARRLKNQMLFNALLENFSD